MILFFFVSARSEANSSDTMKNIVNMKSVIITVVSTICLAVPLILLRYVDQSHIPFNLILTVSIFTLYLVKFAQNQKILEYSKRRLTQKKNEVIEKVRGLKTAVFKVRENQVGIQTVETPRY